MGRGKPSDSKNYTKNRIESINGKIMVSADMMIFFCCKAVGILDKNILRIDGGFKK